MGDLTAAENARSGSASGATSRRQILTAAGVGAAATLIPVSAARAHNLDEGFTGNFVVAEVVSSSGGVLQVKRIGDDTPISIVTNASTKLPEPALAKARKGQIVGINAPQIARASDRATLTATVVAPCVLGKKEDVKRLRDAG